MIYFPITIILGRVPIETYLAKFGLGLLWLGASYLLFILIWRQGLKRFSAVGA
jgi:ABC-type uncharacterized transport system permease subunit